MDTRQMRLFVALGETLHFGHAAARMNMTQPPFSRQIARLEQELGAQLVERSPRRVRLTAAGQRFLEESRAVLAHFDEACGDARRVAEGRTGALRLGFMMHSAQRLVPALVRRYAAARPDVRLHLIETTPADIEDQLTAGALDAGITFAGRSGAGLESLELMRTRLCLVAAPGHPLAACDRITPALLRGAELIGAPAATAPMLRAAITAYLGRAGGISGAPVPFRFEPQLQNTILHLVAADLGVALVPESICEGLGPELVTRPLADPPELTVLLKTRRGNDNPAVAPLLELAREIAA